MTECGSNNNNTKSANMYFSLPCRATRAFVLFKNEGEKKRQSLITVNKVDEIDAKIRRHKE